jgi:hypothetical protein
MRSHALIRLSFVSLLALSLAACGVGKRQSPVGADDEAGQTKPVQIEEDKPAFYVTKTGDTLRSIAGRDEIYGEPDLWPLLLDANTDTLGAQSARSKLPSGIRLNVPRGQDQDALNDAREKARQAAAASKGPHKARVQEAPVADEYAKAMKAKAQPLAKAKPVVKAQTPVVAANPVSEEPKPVPKAKKTGGLLPVLFFLLLLLAVLSAVLFYFTRRDQKDEA